MKKSIQKVVRVSGEGKSKEHAIASALSKIQKQVMEEMGNILLRIEPVKVTVVRAEEVEFTERFLFFFFPRKRQNYTVTLDVEVDMSYMNVSEVPFRKVEVKQSKIGKVLGNNS